MNVLQMSISAGVLILAVVIIRAFTINKLPKATFLVLWGIALCTLVIPYRIPSRFSVYNMFNNSGGAIVSNSETMNNYPGSVNMIFSNTENSFTTSGILAEPVVILWLIGAAAYLIFFAAAFFKSHREIRTALPLKEHTMINKWLSKQNTFRRVSILVSDKITTPLSYGIFKPKIILPKKMDFDNELQMRHILAHEMIHIKRFDTLWKMLLIVVTCFHWFNPIVWVLYVLMNRDLEISCDEKVVKLFGESARSDYAMSLIQMAEQRSKHKYSPLYSGFSRNAAEERIVSIMKFKKTSVFTLTAALLIVGGITTAFATTSDSSDSSNADIQSASELAENGGEISIDGETYTFSSDDQGEITVRDAEENVISTTKADNDGNAVLKDGAGNEIGEVSIASDSTAVSSGGDEAFPEDMEEGTVSVSIDGDNTIIVKDADGNIISERQANSDGTTIVTDGDGNKIGEVIVDGDTVTGSFGDE